MNMFFFVTSQLYFRFVKFLIYPGRSRKRATNDQPGPNDLAHTKCLCKDESSFHLLLREIILFTYWIKSIVFVG